MPIPLLTYKNLEDAWAGGVADWCRSVARFALNGGQAWCVSAGPGQTGWIKRQLLAAGTPVFGVRFLDSAADLRRALCGRFGVEAPPFGRETLELLVRVRADARGNDDPAAARQPGPLLGALEELDAAGWLDGENFAEVETLLPPTLLADGLLGRIRRHPAWTPGLDRRLRALAEGDETPGNAPPPLSVLVLGWDAACWRRLDLLAAALRAATGYRAAFLPLPRAEAEALSQGWLEAVASALGAREWETCPPAEDAPESTPLGRLVERLESLEAGPPEDEDVALPVRPEMLVGRNGADQVALARDFVARWLGERGKDEGEGTKDAGGVSKKDTVPGSPPSSCRLAILTPGRSPTAVALGRALGEAGICFEDTVGERPETALPGQIARAVVDYYLDDTGVGPLLTLVGLLNDHPECLDAHEFGLPLDPLALRSALAEAFTDLQHTSAPLLAGGGAFGRSTLAGPVRRLVEHLGRWPETLGWAAARARWEATVRGFRLHAAGLLGPSWGRAAGVLPADEAVGRRAFFEYLRSLLAASSGGGNGARVMPEGGTRFARVCLTTVAEAANQTWHSLLFLDCNEGVWPRPPAENPFLDERRRAGLNALRAGMAEGRGTKDEGGVSEGGATSDPPPASFPLLPSALLTAGDRVRLDACRLYATLENAAPEARLAFASVRFEASDPGREAHPNEWSLRCWIEAASAAERAADGWLARWRGTTWRVAPPVSRRKGLPGAEAGHLREIFGRRRDPERPFDEYGFDFRALGAAPAAGELAFEPAWNARELAGARECPAAFALAKIFGVAPVTKRGGTTLPGKAEAWAVGRLAHRWVRQALHGGPEPEPLDARRVARALDRGLAKTTRDEAAALRRSLGLPDADELPAWWRSVLAKTGWATRRCLEELAARVAADPAGAAYFCTGREWDAAIPTPAGPLRLRGRSDLLLLDRPTLAGAACVVVDVKTGGSAGAPTAKDAAEGRTLGLAAELFLAVASGADPARSTVAVLHPEAGGWDGPGADGLAGLLRSEGDDSRGGGGALVRLAGSQRGLRFGQGPEETELPLAMTPIPARVLAAKASRGD